MPELPEVETIRRGLARRVIGRTVARAEVRLAKQVEGMGAAAFARALKGRTIRAVRRRSKFLILQFDPFDLYIHLGMSGQVTFWDHRRPDTAGFVRHKVTGLQKTTGQHAPDKHTHVLLHLEGGDRIQYRDIRQFGYLRLLRPGEESRWQPLLNLGVEPLEKSFTREAFEALLKEKRGQLKPMLLSQRPVCGLGNIYADEAAHRAGLHPLQKIERMGEAGRDRLYEAIPAVLRLGLKNGGTTLSDFVGAGGEHGRNKESLRVYGRGGQPCLACGKTLKKIQVAQRTTVFCPACQRRR